MLALGPGTRIFLATGATDMRKGFNGLYALVSHVLGEDPLCGHVFVFCNRRRYCLKLFVFDGSGMWVCAKRLERGTYRWPQAAERTVLMEPTELHLLLGGIDLGQATRRRWWKKPEKKEDNTANIT